ncbi:ABC transporter ATP-binding protein/permease [bacterium]|nr:ABC transporter ATP-binding protein/permease [bacterium]
MSKTFVELELEDDFDFNKFEHTVPNLSSKKTVITRSEVDLLRGLISKELTGLKRYCCLAVFSAGFEMMPPLILGVLLQTAISDEQSNARRLQTVDQLAAMLMLVYAVNMVIGSVKGYMGASIASRILTRLQLRLFNAIMLQDIAVFDSTKSGDLLSRLTQDCGAIQGAITGAAISVLQSCIKGGVGIVFMIWASPLMAGMFFCVFPGIAVVAPSLVRALKSISTQNSVANAGAVSVAQEIITSIRTLRSFAAEGLGRKLYTNYLSDPDNVTYRYLVPVIPGVTATSTAGKLFRGEPIEGQTILRLAVLANVASSMFISALSLWVTGVMVLVMWKGFRGVVDGSMTAGQLFSFFMYSSFVMGAIIAVMTGTIGVMGSLGSVARVNEVITLVPEIPIANEMGLRPSTMKGSICFRHVYFSYPTRPTVPILRGLSLSMHANKSTALVGGSGGGKTTVLSILERFYNIRKGVVLVDGVDICDLDVAWLRQRISYVQQEPVLFSCSIAENIGFSRRAQSTRAAGGRRNSVATSMTDDELIKASRQANAHQFVTTLAKGYETEVGERGTLLSGGQKQRIAIARAIIANPRILLLDEATSALDTESEHLVQQAIERMMVNRTVVVIAHRLSTIINMDQIAMLVKGRVVDVGKHDVLLKRCAAYQHLVNSASEQ